MLKSEQDRTQNEIMHSFFQEVNDLKEIIDSLNVKLRKEEVQFRNDKRLKNLEENLNTFRSEALRLKD
jgi:hypothetical protein